MKNKVQKRLLLTATACMTLIFSACGNTYADTVSGQEETVVSTENTGDSENAHPSTSAGFEEPENTESMAASRDSQQEVIPVVKTQETESDRPEETLTEEKEQAEDEYTYVEMTKTMYAQNAVNVRNTPSVSGKKLGSLSKNQEVTITGQCRENGWYRISYENGEAFVSNKYLSNEKVTETAKAAKTTSTGSTDFLTPDGFLNPNNPIVAAAYAKYGENIAIAADGTVMDAATWQELGRMDGVAEALGNESFEYVGYDKTAAEEVWNYVNEERISNGLNPLSWDEDIYNFACRRAEQIITDFSHNGCAPYGENIQYQSGTSADAWSIHVMWYLSPGHHSNYLNADYGSGACAVYIYKGMIYAVENFAPASNSGAQNSSTENGGNAGSDTDTSNTRSELVGEIETGENWTASNGVTLFIRSDGLVSVTGSGEHTSEESRAALDEYYASH